jgi:hypothetical protein
MQAFVAALVLALGCGVAVAQPAYTVRDVAVKKEPYDDATTVGKLAERAQVEVTKRLGGWVEIRSTTVSGWVRMLSVRMGSPGETRTGSSGLGSLFGFARSGGSGASVTTGVRGLDKEQIQNAQPNLAELQKLQGFAVSKQDAQAFAGADPRLAPQRVDYLAAPSAFGTPATSGAPATPVPGASPFSQ